MPKGLHMPTQNERILEWLKDHNSITTYEAMTELGIARLASRITDLRKLWYVFRKEYVKTYNRFGERTSYVAYSLMEEPA